MTHLKCWMEDILKYSLPLGEEAEYRLWCGPGGRGTLPPQFMIASVDGFEDKKMRKFMSVSDSFPSEV